MLPKQSEIEVSLRAIEAAGGCVAPRDVYPAVTAAFAEASDKRILRVEPTPGSIAYITCLGAPFSGSTVAAGDGG